MKTLDYRLSRALARLCYGRVENHPLLRGLPEPLRKPARFRISFSRKHNFFYMRVPKAANSTISMTLLAHMRKLPPGADDPTPREAKQALHGLPSLAQFEKSYRFTFVRDPAERVLSAWRDKGHRQKYFDKYGVHRKGDPSSPMEFRQFLEALDGGLLDQEIHWAPQALILPFKGKGYDLIGHVGRLEEQLEEVCRAIFGRFDGVHTLEKGRTGAAKDISQMVGDAERALIRRMYQEDYDLFFSAA